MSCDFNSTEYGHISGDFTVKKLSDVCSAESGIQTGPFGSQLHKSDYVESGTPIITVEHLGENYIRHANTPFVSKADKERLSKYILKEGDIVFSRVGSVDRRALVTAEEDGWMFSGRCLRVRPNPEKIDPVYLSYFMGLKAFKEHIRSVAVGATMPSINTKILSGLSVYFPRDLRVQKKIGEIFQFLDAKIKINVKTNQTLEQIAQAIFKSWFVDFEPVKAKINALEAGGSEEHALLAAMQAISGKDKAQLTQLQTDNPEHYNQLRTTAELFPSAMQDSELGEIPEGWSASTVGEEFDVTMGQSPPGSTYNEQAEGIPFFQGRRDFGKRFPSERVYCTAPKRMANKGDTLLSVRAPVGDSNIALADCCIGRGLAALRHKSQSSSFTYYSVKQLGKELASYDSEGTVFGSINQKNLKALSVIKPCAQLVGAFESYAGSLDKTIFTKSKESQTLKQTRDTLLPKLLSGKLIINSPADSEEIL